MIYIEIRPGLEDFGFVVMLVEGKKEINISQGEISKLGAMKFAVKVADVIGCEVVRKK